ncbi:MAG TPA: hypothetical protein VGF10_04975 [Gaiella sp.]
MIDVLVAMQIARQVQREQFGFDEADDRHSHDRRKRSPVRGVSLLRRSVRARREPARRGELGPADAC